MSGLTFVAAFFTKSIPLKILFAQDEFSKSRFKVTSLNQGYCCGYSLNFFGNTIFFRYMSRYSCTCLASNLPIINGLPKEALEISNLR